MSEDLEQKTLTLCLKQNVGVVTSESLKSNLAIVFDEFDITKKVVSLNTNDENIQESLTLLKNEENNIVEINPCLENVLQKTSDSVLSSLESPSEDDKEVCEQLLSTINKCRNLSNLFAHSSQLKEQLVEKQLIVGKTKKTAITIVLEVNSKWHSFFSSLQCINSLHDHIYTILSSHQKYKEMRQYMLDENQTIVLKDILSVFEKFFLISDDLLETEMRLYGMCGDVIKYLDFLRNKLISENNDKDSNYKKFLRKIILRSLDSQTSEFKKNTYLLSSSFLCPINKSLKRVDKRLREITITSVKRFLMDTYKTHLEKIVEAKLIRSETLSDLQRESKKKKIDLNEFDSDNDDEISNESGFDQEFNKYIDIIYNENTEDPLDFWKKQQANFPIFSELAFLLLSAPAISTPSHVLYLNKGYNHFEQRNKVSPNHLDSSNFIALNILEIE